MQAQHTITGQHLFSSAGDDIGEITDVVGAYDGDMTPRWLTVKTGWFSQRLVPWTIVVEGEDGYVTACTASEVKHAPKVPVHFEPAGDDLDELCDYYALRPSDV